MGGITFFLFLVETVTGVLLMFYYRPTLEHAYNDILDLRHVATLGILRELHRWGAHAMVISDLAAHVSRLSDRAAKEATASSTGGSASSLLGGDAAAQLYWLLASVGSARRSGRSRSERTWPVRRRSSATGRARGAAVPQRRRSRRSSITARMRASSCLGGRFVGENTLLRFYALHCVAHSPGGCGSADRGAISKEKNARTALADPCNCQPRAFGDGNPILGGLRGW